MEPRTEPSGTPAKMFFPRKNLAHSIQPFVYDLPFNLLIVSISYHLFHMISVLILNLHAKLYLSKAFEIYKKVSLMSASGSKSKRLYISCVIDYNCATHE